MKRLTDPLPFIRNSPERFLRQTPATGHELATALASDAILLTDAPTALLRAVGGWWVVGCEADWMSESENNEPLAAFSQMLPFPQAGPNSMRAEVLITAFSTVAVTVGRGKRHVVVGDVDENDSIWKTLEERPDWGRSVAFKVSTIP